jgi:hypothetical protein
MCPSHRLVCVSGRGIDFKRANKNQTSDTVIIYKIIDRNDAVDRRGSLFIFFRSVAAKLTKEGKKPR